MPAYEWYAELVKPSWAPPSWLFGPVWTVLYVIIAASFGAVFLKFFKRQVSGKIATLFAANLVFNFAFTPIQFGLRNNVLAMVDIFLVLGTLIVALLSVRRLIPWVAYANIPYVAWVSFATVLQVTITVLNA